MKPIRRRRPTTRGAKLFRWERRKHPLLAEAVVFVFALGLIAYVAFDPHRLSAHPRLASGLLAAVLLMIVIGWRRLRRGFGR